MNIRWPGIRSSRRSTFAWTALALAIVVTVAGLGVSTLAWATTLQDEGRLLPGTTISGVDVGGATRAEAVALVEAQLARQLDRPVTITSGGRSWETTARELGARSDAEDVVEQAHQRIGQTGPTTLARIRWSSAGAQLTLTANVALPEDASERVVADIASRTDRAARDATVVWTGTAVEVTPHEPGLHVERGPAAEVLRSAVRRGDGALEIPTRASTPTLTTDAAEQIAGAVDASLDRTISLQHQRSSWDVTVRDLGAIPLLEPLVDAASAGEALPEPTFSLPETFAGSLAAIGSELRVPARSARVELVGGQPRITPERAGMALDREAATRALEAAINDREPVVVLPTTTTPPSVTAAALNERMLLVDLAGRRVHLYRHGEAVRSWAVAVGSGDSPTPSGMFTVGAKRYEPTWHNPAPDRWGSGMPATIGPGPDNPLGARALNWNQDGRDTLIRFHGTPNEASIGHAASRGCIRMRNADVIELYDLVPSGTPIVSIAG